MFEVQKINSFEVRLELVIRFTSHKLGPRRSRKNDTFINDHCLYFNSARTSPVVRGGFINLPTTLVH